MHENNLLKKYHKIDNPARMSTSLDLLTKTASLQRREVVPKVRDKTTTAVDFIPPITAVEPVYHNLHHIQLARSLDDSHSHLEHQHSLRHGC